MIVRYMDRPPLTTTHSTVGYIDVGIYNGELLIEAGRKTIVEIIVDEKDLCAVMIREASVSGYLWRFYVKDTVWQELLWRALSKYNRARVRVASFRGVRVRDLVVYPGDNRGGEEMEDGLITLEALEKT